jgi:hypothetical protein
MYNITTPDLRTQRPTSATIGGSLPCYTTYRTAKVTCYMINIYYHASPSLIHTDPTRKSSPVAESQTSERPLALTTTPAWFSYSPTYSHNRSSLRQRPSDFHRYDPLQPFYLGTYVDGAWALPWSIPTLPNHSSQGYRSQHRISDPTTRAHRLPSHYDTKGREAGPVIRGAGGKKPPEPRSARRS